MKIVYLIATLALAIFDAANAQTDNDHAAEQKRHIRARSVEEKISEVIPDFISACGSMCSS